MGTVAVSEVLNDTHPWSNMLDARSHHTDHPSYETSYRNPSNHRRNSSRTPRSTSYATQPSSRTSHNTATDTSASAPAAETSSQGSNPPTATPTEQASRPEGRPEPASPHLSPASADARPSTARKNSSPVDVVKSSTESGDATPGSQVTDNQSQPTTASPQRIKVKDLQHIASFAAEDMGSVPASPRTDEGGSTPPPPQYEISDMPIGDVIEMVAGLLTKITTTNDQHHEHLHRQIPGPEAVAQLSQTTTSVLAFHGKNVPSITILSYLSRIHKYCPATWEVFLSLLVYFDRMTERVNSGHLESLRQADQDFNDRFETFSDAGSQNATQASVDNQSPLSPSESRSTPSPPSESESTNLAHFFVVDSFNIHRLVIAGVTCAAKYFSDIFFTNSRYAKVGGLPLLELNHLELQFLLLNDFRLAVPVEELEAYATMLVEFYAREVVAQRQSEAMEGIEMVAR